MKTSLTILTAIATGVLLLMVISEASKGNSRTFEVAEPVPLKLRYQVGKTLYYRLVRHTTMYGMDGSKFGEHRALAYFTRTRLQDDSQGRVTEDFTWKRFAFGQSMNPDAPAQLSCLKEADNFSLTLCVQDEDMLSKLDFSNLPRTMDGFWFMVMSWDAVTFDGLVRPQKYFPFPDDAFIGTETKSTRGPHDFQFEYPPLVTDSKYSFSGKSSSRLLGVGVIKDIPCAIVEFSSLGNTITMNFDLDPVELRTQGFENFWGKTYLSLEDGRVVKGELVAPVAHVQDMLMPGQDEPQHMEFLALQKLDLEMLVRQDFDSEIKRSGPGEDH